MEPVVTVKGLTITLADRTFPVQTVIVANAAVFRYFGLDNKAAAIIGPALLRYQFAGDRFHQAPHLYRTVRAQPPCRRPSRSRQRRQCGRAWRGWFPATADRIGGRRAFAASSNAAPRAEKLRIRPGRADEGQAYRQGMHISHRHGQMRIAGRRRQETRRSVPSLSPCERHRPGRPGSSVARIKASR